MRIPDLDDIVFEKLNKEYGAYSLRKRYNHVVSISIVSAVILGSLIVLIPFLSTPEQTNKEIFTSRFVTMDNLMVPPVQAGVPLSQASSPVQVKAPARLKSLETNYTAPEVVDSLPFPDKLETSKSDSITGGVSEQGDINGTGNEKGSISGHGTGDGGSGGAGTGSYSLVDEMPTFKGGDINKFREWVQRKTKYPEVATINGIQGRVYVTFIVEKDGSVTNGKVVKGVDPLIDNEALKAVMSSPRWSPGKLRGESVRVSYIIMLNFQL